MMAILTSGTDGKPSRTRQGTVRSGAATASHSPSSTMAGKSCAWLTRAPLLLKPVYRENYPPDSFFTEPQTVCYDKPVVVMVNPRNISSGEGIPMMLQKFNRGKIVSFYGTNGSFGLCSRVFNKHPQFHSGYQPSASRSIWPYSISK